MKKILVYVLSFLLALMPTLVLAAAACTATKTVISENGITWYVLVRFAWTSHTDGSVPANTCSVKNVSGLLSETHFLPDSNATYTPTTLYDTVVTDQNSLDLTSGLGANLVVTQGAVTNYRSPKNNDGEMRNLHGATITPAVTNAGSGKRGVINMILR